MDAGHRFYRMPIPEGYIDLGDGTLVSRDQLSTMNDLMKAKELSEEMKERFGCICRIGTVYNHLGFGML